MGEGHCAIALPVNRQPSSSAFLQRLEDIARSSFTGCSALAARASSGVSGRAR
jgi:hypothetical protein